MSELTGAELDLAVALIEGIDIVLDDHGVPFVFGRGGECYTPSTDWARLGPLIGKYGINLNLIDLGKWQGHILGRNAPAYGPTPLIAACRAIVASKEEV